MPNMTYENSVLEAKLTELVNSKLEVRTLMSVDDSLAEGAGLTKIINRYTYRGSVEALNAGEANDQEGEVTFSPESYTVKRYQQTFRYNDVEAMKDPAMIDAAMEGMAEVMMNQIRREYFEQLMRIRHRHPISGDTVTYSDIVEALGNIGREVEDGLFIIMSLDARSAIRLDPDFTAAHQGEVMYTGQFGTLCGIPVLFSRLVPDGMVIITERSAVKFFVKREAGLEQSRNIETKTNTVVYERHGVIALVDDTSSIILGTAADALTASASVSSGKATLSVTKSDNDDTIVYALDHDAPLAGEDVSSWKAWDGSSTIDLGSASKIALAEIDADGKIVASACVDAE